MNQTDLIRFDAGCTEVVAKGHAPATKTRCLNVVHSKADAECIKSNNAEDDATMERDLIK